MTEEHIRAELRGCLQRFFPADQLRDDEDIFAAGFVTSLMALELVQFLETRLHVEVEDGDLNMDNFRSVDALTALVLRRTAAA
jgi:methoxymalonate biosynthesis acyl carrier protein